MFADTYRTRIARLPFGLIGAALAAALILSGCSAKPEAEEAPTVTVQVAGAANEPIQRKVTADAVLYPLEQAGIVPKVSSPVSKFYVDKGSKVKAGELLADLESQDLTGALAENQGEYQQAESSYQTELQKAEQDLALAKQVMDAAQKVYDSRVGLLKQGAVSEKDVDDAQVSLTEARNAYELAQKQPDLKAAEAGLNAAKGRNATATAQLSYTKIFSPIDGVVTDRPVYPGETAPAGSPIITVMNLSQVVARTHISEEEAAQLKAGDEARIMVPGESKSIPGKVMLVSPALDQGSTTVEVWVKADNPGSVSGREARCACLWWPRPCRKPW